MSERTFTRAVESFTVAVQDRLTELTGDGTEETEDTREILGEIAQLLHELP